MQLCASMAMACYKHVFALCLVLVLLLPRTDLSLAARHLLDTPADSNSTPRSQDYRHSLYSHFSTQPGFPYSDGQILYIRTRRSHHHYQHQRFHHRHWYCLHRHQYYCHHRQDPKHILTQHEHIRIPQYLSIIGTTSPKSNTPNTTS